MTLADWLDADGSAELELSFDPYGDFSAWRFAEGSVEYDAAVEAVALLGESWTRRLPACAEDAERLADALVDEVRALRTRARVADDAEALALFRAAESLADLAVDVRVDEGTLYCDADGAWESFVTDVSDLARALDEGPFAFFVSSRTGERAYVLDEVGRWFRQYQGDARAAFSFSLDVDDVHARFWTPDGDILSALVCDERRRAFEALVEVLSDFSDEYRSEEVLDALVEVPVEALPQVVEVFTALYEEWGGRVDELVDTGLAV